MLNANMTGETRTRTRPYSEPASGYFAKKNEHTQTYKSTRTHPDITLLSHESEAVSE